MATAAMDHPPSDYGADAISEMAYDLCRRALADNYRGDGGDTDDADDGFCASFADGFAGELEYELSASHGGMLGGRLLLNPTTTTMMMTSEGRLLDSDRHDVVDDVVIDATFYLVNIGGATASVLLVALISAMFLGFLTLDPFDVRIKMRAAVDPSEREAAAAIYPLVQQNHRLMITLLMMNALAYECLPLFLDNLMPTWLTIIFSVTMLLVFGEVIPSAIFTGPDQLALASRLAPVVRASMTILHPLTHPLVLLLDRIVPSNNSNESEDDEEYNRAELSALVRIQFEERMKAQRRDEMANFRRGSGQTRTKSSVQHMANQIQADKARTESRQQQQLMNDSYFKSSNNWRRLKDEIMQAVNDKQQQLSSAYAAPDEDILGRDAGMPPPLRQHRRNPSNSSLSSMDGSEHSSVPFEQIAPPLDQTEVRAVEGALKLKTMCALDVYTPHRVVFSLREDLELTKQNIAAIYGQGYSRVPVYDPSGEGGDAAMRGILMTRQLILIDWDDERTVSSLSLCVPPCVSPRMNPIRLLHLLRKGGNLMAFVCAGPHIAERALDEGRAIPPEAGFMGLVTLQDVLESLIQERIYDETDTSERNLASAVLTNWAAEVLQRFAKKLKSRRSSSADRVTQPSPRDRSEATVDESTPLLE